MLVCMHVLMQLLCFVNCVLHSCLDLLAASLLAVATPLPQEVSLKNLMVQLSQGTIFWYKRTLELCVVLVIQCGSPSEAKDAAFSVP